MARADAVPDGEAGGDGTHGAPELRVGDVASGGGVYEGDLPGVGARGDEGSDVEVGVGREGNGAALAVEDGIGLAEAAPRVHGNAVERHEQEQRRIQNCTEPLPTFVCCPASFFSSLRVLPAPALLAFVVFFGGCFYRKGGTSNLTKNLASGPIGMPDVLLVGPHRKIISVGGNGRLDFSYGS